MAKNNLNRKDLALGRERQSKTTPIIPPATYRSMSKSDCSHLIPRAMVTALPNACMPTRYICARSKTVSRTYCSHDRSEKPQAKVDQNTSLDARSTRNRIVATTADSEESIGFFFANLLILPCSSYLRLRTLTTGQSCYDLWTGRRMLGSVGTGYIERACLRLPIVMYF